MKFLVISKRKEAYMMLPIEKQLEIMQGTVAFIQKSRNAGKCKAIYFLGDLQGSVSIWEADSDEESIRIIIENPITRFSDLDIRPLIDWDLGVRVLI
jgi:hypothetical protein